LAPLLAVCCVYFMVILDVTIVNVAAPAIGRDRGRRIDPLGQVAGRRRHRGRLHHRLNEVGRQGIRGPAVIGGVLVAAVAAVAAVVPVLRERFSSHPPLHRRW